MSSRLVSNPAMNMRNNKPTVSKRIIVLSRAKSPKPLGPTITPASINPTIPGRCIFSENRGAISIIPKITENMGTGSLMGVARMAGRKNLIASAFIDIFRYYVGTPLKYLVASQNTNPFG
jgi:hypothetical protein